MNLHVHSAHRQRKSLGCEHKKRVEKRWRITCADIRPGVNGPLVIIISSFVPTGCNKCLVYNGFYCFCVVVASQYGKGRNISVSCLRYLANHNALDSRPIRAHLASQQQKQKLTKSLADHCKNSLFNCKEQGGKCL